MERRILALGSFAAHPVKAFKVVLTTQAVGEPATIAVPAGKFSQSMRIESVLSYSGGPYESKPEHLLLTD